ncbi:hypothetical protein [Pseudomonas sp. NUPR-001]|uniref:hypothetical protein n=1 Tax=Pseudomonas sp. NUPR-001 TaxID=3416058 RepID=UPI003F993591
MSTQTPFSRKKMLEVITLELPKPVKPPYFPDAEDGTLHWNRLPLNTPVIFDYPGHSGLEGLQALEITLIFNNNDWYKKAFPGAQEQAPFTADDTINKNRLSGEEVIVECLIKWVFSDRIEELRGIRERYAISRD